METYIKNKIQDALDKYNIQNIKIGRIIKEETRDYMWCFTVSISGGDNGHGRFSNYLEDVKHIIDQFDRTWLIKWENDCPDDVWYLKFGIEFV